MCIMGNLCDKYKNGSVLWLHNDGVTIIISEHIDPDTYWNYCGALLRPD